MGNCTLCAIVNNTKNIEIYRESIIQNKNNHINHVLQKKNSIFAD